MLYVYTFDRLIIISRMNILFRVCSNSVMLSFSSVHNCTAHWEHFSDEQEEVEMMTMSPVMRRFQSLETHFHIEQRCE